jgi:transcriptional regulator with XRE-family HTH domain
MPYDRMVSLIPFIAKRLRALRLRHALTQQECADLMGVGFKFYQLLEAGTKKQIWLETVERAARAFGLEAWEFLAPAPPERTRLRGKVVPSSAHNKRRRRGPYGGKDAA